MEIRSFFPELMAMTMRNFERLLSLPHAFIFHRDHFETGDGQGIREEYEQMRCKLSASQQSELISLLSLLWRRGLQKSNTSSES